MKTDMEKEDEGKEGENRKWRWRITGKKRCKKMVKQ